MALRLSSLNSRSAAAFPPRNDLEHGFGLATTAGRGPIDPSKHFDVLVYGATASGVMVATSAAQEEPSVALVEPG